MVSRTIARRGAGFATVIADGIHSIRTTPHAGQLWRGREDVRRRVLRRFPYSIIYVVDGAAIVIVAIAHHRRLPGYWLSRLGARATP